MTSTDPLHVQQATSQGGAPCPFVFVVGCPRSGTTLLQRMLDNHPLLTVANDTHFIPRAVAGYGSQENPVLTDELVQKVRSYRRFHRLGVDDDAVAAAAERSSSYSGFVSALYEELARKHGKVLAGEKTPDYVRYLPFLHRLFPDTRAVHIVRDGRDVALSTLEWATDTKGPGKLNLWKQEPIATCALWWSWQVQTGRCDGVQLGPDRYFEVIYEELLADVEGELRRMCGFLGLPFEQSMATYYEGKGRKSPKLSAKSAWLPPTKGLRDWRTHMAPRDQELFEALAGDLLSELGFERRYRVFSVEVQQVAESCRRWWGNHLRHSIRCSASMAS